MSATFARILSELADPTNVTDNMRHEHNPFHLATLADCASPDSVDSPGARFLAGIARDVAEHITNGNMDDDDNRWRVSQLQDAGNEYVHEIADSAVPVYTGERWQTFTDLAAWQEDVTELGVDASDLTEAAGVALYMIAERLVAALAAELSEALDADADDDDEPVDYTRDYTLTRPEL